VYHKSSSSDGRHVTWLQSPCADEDSRKGLSLTVDKLAKLVAGAVSAFPVAEGVLSALCHALVDKARWQGLNLILEMTGWSREGSTCRGFVWNSKRRDWLESHPREHLPRAIMGGQGEWDGSLKCMRCGDDHGRGPEQGHTKCRPIDHKSPFLSYPTSLSRGTQNAVAPTPVSRTRRARQGGVAILRAPSKVSTVWWWI
jgi:hypothetical protein